MLSNVGVESTAKRDRHIFCFTFRRKHGLLLRSALTRPGSSPQEVRRLAGGAGLEGEDAREDGFACQRLLHRRMGDPTHVHDGGGCTYRGEDGQQERT